MSVVRFTAALAAALPLACAAQPVDFAQVDTSSEATTAVLVRALPSRQAPFPQPLVSATYSRWHTGEAASVGAVYRWALTGEPHRWVVGAGVGANTFKSRAPGDEHRDSALSARVQSEFLGPAPGGSYYALAQASTFRGAWFATLQYSLARLPLAFEASSYHEASYRANSLGLRIGLGADKWFVRLGATRTNDRTVPFIGLTYNGF